MMTELELGGIRVDVVQKDIKNVHLSVYPPSGRVKISAPLRMNAETIRVFAISKIGWIRQQHAKLRGQERESPREYIDRESHYVWGNRYLLKVETCSTRCRQALTVGNNGTKSPVNLSHSCSEL
jgi:predicted metal-dependent hydrolase